ncbi:uncharacterized protein LOC111868708 isoform X3 [Cryptotermes secundus]|uniref:uncharacterized protein LOC111868708 isoform X3 n=1 Tax=Cryptotermes secundus TaxID=105785 RepID=UPI000CD7D503|nr:uncharacterized protein LOC111868708 isoform X3 [Cryptotermes secundus]
MEPFLPSEIARLVYGYLEELKCDNAAQSFLEHCSHLSECLAVNKKGKGFNTRPAGYSLTDILDEYCEIRSMVAEYLQKLPKNSVEKLQHCDSLIGQLRYLMDATQSGRTLLVSIKIPPQTNEESSAQGNSKNVTSAISTQNRIRIIGCADRVKRTAVVSKRDMKQQGSKDGNERAASVSSSVLSVEATPLENLPGISALVDNQSVLTEKESRKTQTISLNGHTAVCEHIDHDFCLGTSPLKPTTGFSKQYKKCCDNRRTLKHQHHSPSTKTSPAVGGKNNSQIEDGSACFSTPKQKYNCSSKRKSTNPTPVKGIHTPMKSQTPCKKVLTRALLDNKELHEKIAENINKVIHKPVPGQTSENIESVPSPSPAGEPDSAEAYPVIPGPNSAVSSCDGMLQELNQAIKTIVDQTEQDPVFERFLEEIIGPLDEELTPSPVELQSEDDDAVPDLPVATKQAKNVNIGSHCNTSNPNKKSTSLSSATVTGCSKDEQHVQEQRLEEDSPGKLNNDVPLKQRLRSATLHKSDAASDATSGRASSTSSSGKAKKKEGPSLEDQNAAAVQCIVDAKISSQKISEVTHNHQSQKNGSVDTQAVNTASPIDRCQEKLSHSSPLMKGSSATVGSLQKETNQISGSGEKNMSVRSSDPAEVANDGVHSEEVILFDGNLTFLDNSASFSVNTETSSNISTPPPRETQLSGAVVAISEPSIYNAGTSQVMAIAVPGTNDIFQGAATLSERPPYPPSEQAAPQSFVTSSASQAVGTFAILDTQTVNSITKQQDVVPMSTVIMCGNDGLFPHVISLPHKDSVRKNYLQSGLGGTHYLPIAPRDSKVCQDPKPGTSKQTKPTTSWRNKRSYSTGKKKVVRNSDRDQTLSKVSKPSTAKDITSYAGDSRDEAKLICSNTVQQNSTGYALGLASIILESPQARIVPVDSVNAHQDAGWENLLGALNLKEAYESSLNSKSKGNELDTGIYSKSKAEADESKVIKSKSEFILQNVDKYPPSPRLMTLVNLSKNLANSGCSPSTQSTGITEETNNRKCSEIKVTQKLRETPQRTIVQGRIDTNSKRMSLSTPRRQRHVRMLDFTTPTKARTIPKELQPKEPSPKTINKLTKTLHKTTNNVVNKARSSLFKFPVIESGKTTVSGAPLLTTVSSFSKSCSDNCHGNLPPIATRSPMPQLSGGWDNAAGVGQIICDDITVRREARLGDAFGSNLSVTETEDEKNLSDKQSLITQRTSPWKNRETGHKVAPNPEVGSCPSNKSLPDPKKSWDSDLRACLNTDYEGVELPTNDNGSAKKTTKQNKTRTKKMRKSSQKTEEKAVTLRKHLNKDANMDSGGTNLNQESTKHEFEKIPSSVVIPVNKSLHSFDKADLDTETENQNRDLSIEGAILVKGKSDLPKKSVEHTSENAHTYVELNGKLSVNNQSKKCVSVDTLNEKENGKLPYSQVASDQAKAVKESGGEDQAVRVQRKENFALEIAASNKDDFSKSSDSFSVESLSSSPSVVSVLTMAVSSTVTQSPAELKIVEKKIVQHGLHTYQSSKCVDTEMCVIHCDDTGNADTDPVAHASEIGCEVTGSTFSATDDHDVPILQSEEPVSSTSGFYPVESQNKDLQTSQDYKSIPGKEPSIAKVLNNPPSKTSRTQEQECDIVNKSDLQARSAAVPIFDTPRKTDDPASTCSRTEFMHIPLTPRMMSPCPDDTPITKPANGNSCIDFSLIQTPSFPPTPNIAVTPESCSSQGTPSYATRSTDYSSCSSYYKPSGKLDSCSSAKPLEEFLIEECRKLENRIVAETSCAYNEINKENASECADKGQCRPLSVTDKTPEEATPLLSDSVSDFPVTVHVGKELVSGKADEGQVDSLIGSPKRAASPQNQEQRKELTQKRGVTDRDSYSKLEETNIAINKKAGSDFSSGNRDSDLKDGLSVMYTSESWKAGPVSLTTNKSSDFEDKPSETHALAVKSTNRKARTANESSDYNDGPLGTHAVSLITTKGKARPISRANESSSNWENELSEAQVNMYKEPDEKTKDEIIQKHLEAARMKLFGCYSPSDDSDFESSNDFGQSEAETKTVSSNDVNCEALSCHSRIPGDEILSEHDQPTNDLRRLSVSYGNDDAAGTKSHTSLSAKNTTLNNKLDEKNHCMISELKGIDVPASMPNSRVEESVEQDGGTVFTVKSVPDALGPSTSIENNNPTYDGHSVGARKQLRGREDNLARTAHIIPMNRTNDDETMQTKKNSNLSVEAIAERLTKEKTAVQAHPMTQTPACESVSCEDSNSEDFPALHLSSDDETQSEAINLSQVESQVAKLHGGEETTADVSTLRTPPRSVHDVCRDLERTPAGYRAIESGPKLLQAVNALGNEGQEPTCEEQSDTNKCKEAGVPFESVRTNDCKTLKKEVNLSERQENTNKKIRALLGDDVSPLKDLTETRKACRGKEHEILHKLLIAAEKHNSPIKSTMEIELQEKKLDESLRINSGIKGVPENEVLSEEKKVSDSNKIKKGTKSCETCTTEESDSVECRTAALVQCEVPSVEGMTSLATAVKYEQHQVSDNETYVEIVYTDEGPKGNSLVFEDICKFSLTFELGEDSDGVVETYKCTVSEFQELFSASPRECSIESESYESGQFDVKRKIPSSTYKEDRDLDYVKVSKVMDKESFHKGRGAGLYTREHHTRSRSASFGRSADVSHYRMNTSRVHTRSSSPGHRRWALSSVDRKRAQSLDRRSPSSLSPVLSASRMSTFSPLNKLYNEYLGNERESARFTSHSNKGDWNFNFRSREKLPFGQRGRRYANYHNRHLHSKRTFVHSSSRESIHPAPTSSHGISDSYSRMLTHFKQHRPSANKRSTQEGRPIETCSRRLSDDTTLLLGMHSAAKDTGKELATSYIQIEDAMDGRQEMQDTDESLEEGEVVDEDSVHGLNKYKCYDKPKYPSSVESVQAKNFGENTATNLNRKASANNMISDQSLDKRRSVEGRPSQEPEKAPKKSVMKEPSFAVSSTGRALPPKKRKASSEELSVHMEKRIRTDGPQALLKKVDLDHLLDFVHGEKPG